MPSFPENLADDILKDFDLIFPINIKKVCETLSTNSCLIEYEEIPLPDHICGMSIGSENKIQVIVNSKIIQQERLLFTGGHELGHAVLHISTGVNSNFKCTDNDVHQTVNSTKKLEIEANQFSSALLMPRDLIKMKIIRTDITWRLIKKISEMFNTSLEATARRIISLTNEPYALIIHQNQKMWTPIKSKKFSAFIPNSLYPKTLSVIFVKKQNQLPDGFEECDPDEWGIESKANKYNCYYSSIYFEKCNQAMTLLQLEEIDEDEILEWEEPHF